MGEEPRKYKKANIRIPAITPSNHTIQLRKDNNRLITRLEQVERGSFGLRHWFRNI